jgi:hypothetical protein
MWPPWEGGLAQADPIEAARIEDSPIQGGHAAVRKYIQQQEEHHKRISFKDELISLLRKHRIEFDEDDLLD